MKKIYQLLYIAVALIFISLNLNAASFTLVKHDTLTSGAPDESMIAAHAQLYNPTLDKIEIVTYITGVKITKGHAYSVCDPTGCGPQSEKDYQPETNFFIEGATSTGNYINYYMAPNDISGTDILNIKYWIKGKPTDFVEFKVTFIAGTTEVEEITNNSSFFSFAYPSVTSNVISIKLNNTVNNANLEVYDNLGNRVKTESFNGEFVNLNVSELTQGTYYYLINNNGTILSRNSFVVVK